MRAIAAAAGVLLLVGCTGGDPATGSEPRRGADTVTQSPPASAGSRPQAPDEYVEEPDVEEPSVESAERPGASTAPLTAREQARLDARLLAAAWRGDVSTARRLVVRGADINAKDNTVQSAYLVACSEGYLDLLDLTLRYGADLASLDSFQGTGLIRAAERGHADVVGRLLQAGLPPGAGVDHVNNLGWTALLEAVILGDGSTRYVDTVLALRAGAGLEAGDDRGRTRWCWPRSATTWTSPGCSAGSVPTA